MTTLSVIIPTFNSEATIARALNSLLCQTFQDFEICIIDGNSSDETLEKVSDFHAHFKNMRIISEPDQGIYDAMNKGIDIAAGDWLYFLGSDDRVFDESVFAEIFNTRIPKDCGMIYGSVYIDGDASWAQGKQIYDGPFDTQKILLKNICHQAIFYRKSLFQKFGKYKTQYPVCADWELNLRFFLKANPIYLDRVIARFQGGGCSSQVINDPICSVEKLRRRALKGHYLDKLTSFFQSV